MMGMLSLVLTALLQASGVSSCAMSTGYVPFQIGADVQPRDATDDDALHAPKAEVVSITRGVGGPAGSCDAAGILVVSVKPRFSHYQASDVGIELEVRGDAATSPVLPVRFVSIAPDNSRNELLLSWPDAAPGAQRPLQFDVLVRSVTRSYLRGPATVLHIDTRDPDVIKAEAKARQEAELEQEKAARQAEKEKRKLAKEQDQDS